MTGCGVTGWRGQVCGTRHSYPGDIYLCTDCEHVFCPCPTSDFDGIGQCRRCWRADLRAPQFAESRARLDAAHPTTP